MRSSKCSFCCGACSSLRSFFQPKLHILLHYNWEQLPLSDKNQHYQKINNSSKMKRVICPLHAAKRVCNEPNSTTSNALSLSELLRSRGLNAPDWTSEYKARLPCPLRACVLQEKIHEEKKTACFTFCDGLSKDANNAKLRLLDVL